MVLAQVTVPFLRSEYGKEYDFDAPVKLLDKMMHAQADSRDQQARRACAGSSCWPAWEGC